MTTPHDQAWMDLLAGRSAGDVPPDLVKEAALLRTGLLRYPAQEPPGRVPAPEERVSRLVARAREAGVLPEQQPSSPERVPPPSPVGRRRLHGVAVARQGWWPAAVLGLGLSAGAVWWASQPPPTPAPFVLRGDGVLQKPSSSAAQARADRDALQRQLQGAGFTAEAYEQLGRPGLDVEMPQPLTDAQKQALARLGLAAPPGPQLRIEYLPSLQ